MQYSFKEVRECESSLTFWWKGWRQSSSLRPKRSRGREPDSSQSKPGRRRRSGAATPASAQRPTTHTAVAAETQTNNSAKLWNSCKTCCEAFITTADLLFSRRSSLFWLGLCSINQHKEIVHLMFLLAFCRFKAKAKTYPKNLHFL